MRSENSINMHTNCQPMSSTHWLLNLHFQRENLNPAEIMKELSSQICLFSLSSGHTVGRAPQFVLPGHECVTRSRVIMVCGVSWPALFMLLSGECESGRLCSTHCSVSH